MKKITKDEWWELVTTTKEIEPNSIRFSSCCGPHEFSSIIEKDGMLYELFNGFYPEKGQTVEWYGIKSLHLSPNQEGEGI